MFFILLKYIFYSRLYYMCKVHQTICYIYLFNIYTYVHMLNADEEIPSHSTVEGGWLPSQKHKTNFGPEHYICLNRRSKFPTVSTLPYQLTFSSKYCFAVVSAWHLSVIRYGIFRCRKSVINIFVLFKSLIRLGIYEGKLNIHPSHWSIHYTESKILSVCVGARARLCMSVVFVWERVRETEKQTDRQTGRKERIKRDTLTIYFIHTNIVFRIDHFFLDR